MLLYCVTRLLRVDEALASTTGATTGKPLNRPPGAAAVPVIAPIVEDAASFDVVMVSVPFEASVACRLFEANWLFRSLRVATWPGLVPKVRLVAVPPPVDAKESVRLLSCDGPVPRVAVAGALKPSDAKAAVFELEIERSLATPVCRVTWPPETVDGTEPTPVLPDRTSTLVSRLPTVSEIWMCVPSETPVPAAVKVRF